MKRILPIFSAFLLISCISENQKIDNLCLECIQNYIIGYNSAHIISRTDPKWDSDQYRFFTTVKYSYSVKDRYCGTAEMVICLDSGKSTIKSFRRPQITSFSDKPFDYSIMSYDVESAFDNEKVILDVMIPARYDEAQLQELSKYIVYSFGELYENWQLSYYVEGMNHRGPNYALANARANSYGVFPTVEMNILTEWDETSVAESSKLADAPFKESEIIGRYQFIGNSTITVYKKSSKYYMVTFADGEYSEPELLVSQGSRTYRYANDTGETFKVQSDGLYCYFEGDLGAVYNPVK